MKNSISEEKGQVSEAADFETAVSHTGYGRFNILLLSAAFLGIIGNLFGSTALSYVLPAAQCDLNLTNFDKGTLNAMIYAGSMSSPLLWGFLSDNLGRQKLLVFGYLLDGLCSLVSSLAQSVWFLQMFRYLLGFVGCGPYAILVTYLAEFHASQYRSRVILLTSMFVSVAFVAVPALAWVLLPQPWSWILAEGSFELRIWNLFLLVCSIPSLLTGFLMLFFCESPKFLMSRGQRDEAMKVFQHVYSVNTGRKPDTFPVKELVDELSLSTAGPTSVGASNKGVRIAVMAGWEQMRPLFGLKHLPTLTLVITLQLGALLGINTLRLWVPQIFSIIQEFSNSPGAEVIESTSFCSIMNFNKSILAQNISKVENISLTEECTVYVADPWIYINSMIIGSTCGVCIIVASFLINAVGKRMLMIPCFFMAGMSVLTIYWSSNADLTLTLFSLFHGFNEVAISCLVGVTVDVFPTTLRAMALNVTMMFGRLGSLTGNLVFPVLLDLSCGAPFFFITVVLIRVKRGEKWVECL
ncbi:synaptic vesicle glycoprotein 2A isoform X2 [Anabrus simplex]|uniref:synaptic vesicle glycoprotein 2A isoform X2 n=1 Tax=Anabrus simplex TaxID=316456 RepID=UPI0035A2A78B